MSYFLTLEEVHELRLRARRCLSCGKRLPERPSFARHCFQCGWLAHVVRVRGET